MGFSRQEYWSGLSFLPPGELPNPGIEPASPALAGRYNIYVMGRTEREEKGTEEIFEIIMTDFF